MSTGHTDKDDRLTRLQLSDPMQHVDLMQQPARLGLLDDDRVRYGLAYAWMQVGDLQRADRLLGGISDPAVFRQATELRRAMQAEGP